MLIWFCYLEWMIWNGNWTEWSAIWAEIICMISKSNKRAALIWFEITSMTSDENCTTRDSITTLLHPFWNRPNTGLGQFKYFIDAELSRFEIKFIHFLGGKNKSFGNKSCKIYYMILFVFHFPVDNQLHLIHLMLLIVLTALKMPVWLIMTKLNKTHFQYSLFV